MAACRVWPDDDAGWRAVIAQLCLPPRLQHAGSLESASDASTSGLIGARPNRATSSIAIPRSIGTIILPIRRSRTCASANYAFRQARRVLRKIRGVSPPPGRPKCGKKPRNSLKLKQRQTHLILLSGPLKRCYQTGRRVHEAAARSESISGVCSSPILSRPAIQGPH